MKSFEQTEVFCCRAEWVDGEIEKGSIVEFCIVKTGLDSIQSELKNFDINLTLH